MLYYILLKTIITVLDKCEASRRGIIHRVTTRDLAYIKIAFLCHKSKSLVLIWSGVV